MSTEQGLAPEVVGYAFVRQYYSFLSDSPSEAHKFYHDKSRISRPDSEGASSSATTLTGINKLILPPDYGNCNVQIVSIDVQGSSDNNGVMVLVIGLMTGKDNLRRKFTQVFLLVQEENRRYYVLNDIFRHLDDDDGEQLVNIKQPTSVSSGSAPVEPLAPVLEEEDSHPVDNGKVPTSEKEHVNVVDQSVAALTQDSSSLPASEVQEGAPKKSFCISGLLRRLFGNGEAGQKVNQNGKGRAANQAPWWREEL